jgi:hypothetical protein
VNGLEVPCRRNDRDFGVALVENVDVVSASPYVGIWSTYP